MPILKIFTCIGQHRIYQLSDTSLYQRLSRNFKRPLHPWTELWENNNDNNNNNTNINGSTHSDQGYLIRTTKRFAPQMSCILCKKKKPQNTKKQQKKSASDFSTRQRSTPLLPMQLQEGFLYYTYIYTFWLARPADQRKSLHVLVLVTNFYIVNVG